MIRYRNICDIENSAETQLLSKVKDLSAHRNVFRQCFLGVSFIYTSPITCSHKQITFPSYIHLGWTLLVCM